MLQVQVGYLGAVPNLLRKVFKLIVSYIQGNEVTQFTDLGRELLDFVLSDAKRAEPRQVSDVLLHSGYAVKAKVESSQGV